jgi:hypothetical protein
MKMTGYYVHHATISASAYLYHFKVRTLHQLLVELAGMSHADTFP